MMHRTRYTLSQEPLAGLLTGVVEADETYIGGEERKGIATSYKSKKQPVLAFLEREGCVRAFPVEHVTLNNIDPILREHVSPEANLMTDESSVTRGRKSTSRATFRYGTRKMSDAERANIAIKGTEGKRLMLKEPKK